MGKANMKIVVPLLVILLLIVAGGGLMYWQHAGHDHAREGKAGEGKVLYTCPMHPFIVKDRPGTCPICNMELVKKLDGAAGGAQSAEQKQQAEMLGTVSLSPVQRVMANVATLEAMPAALSKEINAVGIVQYDQSRQAKVTAWIAGRIDQLHVVRVGDIVAKGKPVAEVYSPDLVNSQQEYLLAVKSRDQLKNSPIPSIAGSGDGLVSSAKQRLMLFGVREEQIAALEKAGKPNIRLPIYTPIEGVVIEKLVQQGQYVNIGDVLFSIADLSRVWVELELYENELPNISLGQQVEIRSQSFQGRLLTGRIAFIYPFLDPKTRTVKARVEMANPGMKLKPDMFVNAVIRVPLGTSIVVPVTAVIDTGKRQVVWVEREPGMFEPRDVQVGQKTDDKVQILSGLKTGDKVAVSGGYLIDSESQLQSGTGDRGPGTGNGGHAEHSVPPVRQQPVKKDSLKMDDMKM